MKARFQYGIKSYSGYLDGIVYMNYKRGGVVIGRMVPEQNTVTAANVLMGEKMIKISSIYAVATQAYKDDLKAYALKMFQLKQFDGKVSGNGFSVFVKMIWAASKDPDNPLDIMSLTTDDLAVGAYEQFDTVRAAVENGLLPQVFEYEEYQASIRN